VCGEENVRDLGMMTIQTRCKEEAISSAVESVHCPALSAYYAAKHGKSLRIVSPGSVHTNDLIRVSAN
jgi:hypothetical protein